jgi:glycosyltransferase involved in cell wall biosynthesis
MRKYSIILPVRNGGEYVKECIQSLLAQTYSDFNIIVLDNASSDGTTAWIESLRNEKIVLHKSEESLTIEQNWARIKDVPKNEFMTMIGHDDLLHPGYLQEMDDLIERHPAASLYQTHFKYIDGKGNFIRDCLPMVEKQQAHEFLASQMKQEIDSTGTGYLMRSKDFDALGGMPVQYPNLIFSDYHLWLNLMLLGYKATSAKQCFSYRIHRSVSRTTNGMAYQQAFCLYIEHLVQLKEKNKAIAEVIRLYGPAFLLFYCGAMAHRLLKTPMAQRSIKVSDFIKKCDALALRFIPGQEFHPESKLSIRMAAWLDELAWRRALFQKFRKI